MQLAGFWGKQGMAPAFKGPQLYPPFLALVFIPSSLLYPIRHDEFSMIVYVAKWFGRLFSKMSIGYPQEENQIKR